MDEAQHLADRVAVMNAGEIIAIGRPEELGGRDLRPAEIRFVAPGPTGRSATFPSVPSEERSIDGDRVLVTTSDAVVASQRITGWALDHGLELGHFSVTQPTLEDIYLELTGSAEHDHARPSRRRSDERSAEPIDCDATSAWSAGRFATNSAPTGAIAAAGSSPSCSR